MLVETVVRWGFVALGVACVGGKMEEHRIGWTMFAYIVQMRSNFHFFFTGRI